MFLRLLSHEIYYTEISCVERLHSLWLGVLINRALFSVMPLSIVHIYNTGLEIHRVNKRCNIVYSSIKEKWLTAIFRIRLHSRMLRDGMSWRKKPLHMSLDMRFDTFLIMIKTLLIFLDS